MSPVGIKRSGFVVVLYLLLTFASGVAVGGLGFWMYTTRSVSANNGRTSPDEYRRKYMAEMESRLKLSPEQITKLSTILDASRALFREVADKHKPEFDAIQHHQTAQVNGILNETQRAEYTKIQQEREQRRKNFSRGR
ncbi:MAG: hypothetical protein JJE04_09155 [Acidobacteriia bacterium]|nr:hypothetical protein [Terriglobia bacterium]